MKIQARQEKYYGIEYMDQPISGGSVRGMGEEQAEYGACDCYCDCMTAFRWDCKEAAECASACGVEPVPTQCETRDKTAECKIGCGVTKESA